MSRPRKRPRQPGPVPREAWGSVHPLLDLHGETGDSARRRAEAWLRARHGEGVRTVVVVTGRGLHSRGLPVLRGEVEEVLRALKGTVVHHWSDTGGGGGFRVELRSPTGRAAPPPPPQPRVEAEDPELLHQAHEALWELGIAATPALLLAEIRRLRRERGEEG